MPTRKATRTKRRVEESGVRIRLFMKRGSWWADVRLKDRPRVRQSLRTEDRTRAEDVARALARQLAVEQLIGVSSATVTLGQLFAAYHANKGRTLNGQWKRGTEARARMFTEAWGAGLRVSIICQTHVDAFCHARRTAKVASKSRAAAIEAGRKIPQLRDGALDSDFRWLTSVFNWGRKHKVPSGQRLLDQNPLADTTWPREKNVRRPIATHDRYLATLAHADTVDPEGRVRLLLTLARETGRRENAILQLRVADVLLSTKSIARALAAEGRDEGLAKHMPHGAIRWAASSDKMGMLHITPISPRARGELERYISTHPCVGDVPLLPGIRTPHEPLSRVMATKWLTKAEKLAGLPKLLGGMFHPYRRLWASERRHLADVDVAYAGGWKSTKTLEIYQQTDPAAVLAAVVNAAG